MQPNSKLSTHGLIRENTPVKIATPERWRRIEELYHAARGRAPADRGPLWQSRNEIRQRGQIADPASPLNRLCHSPDQAEPFNGLSKREVLRRKNHTGKLAVLPKTREERWHRADVVSNQYSVFAKCDRKHRVIVDSSGAAPEQCHGRDRYRPESQPSSRRSRGLDSAEQAARRSIGTVLKFLPLLLFGGQRGAQSEVVHHGRQRHASARHI